MKLSSVDPELHKALRRLPPMPFGSAIGRGVIQALLSLAPAAKIEGVTIKAQQEPGSPPLRVYVPEARRSDGALLWMHGGGFVIGRAVMDDGFCAATARELGIVVVSVDYRLAPRHPFPAPLDDCHAGWAWLQRAAPSLGVDPRRVAIGGQSAGAGLAASLVQRVHDEGPGRAAAQWLLCPMLDDRTAARRELDATRHWLWDNRNNAIGWRAYLAAKPGASSVPPYAAAARREDLHGLPPAWIGVGDIDLFHEEDRLYAERLERCGVEVAFRSVPAAPHGFEAWAPGTKLAQDFIADARAWLDERLTGLSETPPSGRSRLAAVRG